MKEPTLQNLVDRVRPILNETLKTTAPHYALFSSKGFIGSRRDYQFFKDNYDTYLALVPAELDGEVLDR